MVRPWESLEDNVEILSTSYILTQAEAHALRMRMAGRLAELRCLESEARRIQSRRTVARRHALSQANIIAETLLAPVRKLPAEILGEIFIHTIPELSVDGALEMPPNPFRTEERWDPQDARSALRRVCRQWNFVALGTPRIWTALTINNDLDFLDLQTAVIQSRTLPLDIYIVGSAFVERSGDLVALLRPEIHRIQSFIFAVTKEENVCVLFPSNQYIDMPNLKVFVATANYDVEIPDNYVYGMIGKVNAPRLEFMGLGDKPRLTEHFCTESLRSVRRLFMRYPLAQEEHAAIFLGLLAECPFVTELEISWITSFWDWEGYEGVKVSLHSLKSLVITDSYDSDTADFLESLSVPHLESLHMSLNEYSDLAQPGSIEEGLRALHDETSLSLRELKLEFYDLLEIGGTPSIPPFVNLVILHFSECMIGEALLESLTPDPLAPFRLWPCPLLSRLIFTKVYVTPPGNKLVYLVQTRTCPDTAPRPSVCATSVTLDQCDILNIPETGGKLRVLALRHSRTLTIIEPSGSNDGVSVMSEYGDSVSE